jgi:hypothetical protein
LKKLKKQLILTLNIFHITFWLYRASDKKAASQPFLLLAMYSQKAILKMKSSSIKFLLRFSIAIFWSKYEKTPDFYKWFK